MIKNAIIFDFDGVIADSYDLAFKLNKDLDESFTHESYKKMYEGNLYDGLLEKNSRSDLDKHKQNYWKMYLEQLHEVTLIPGIDKTLDQLSKSYIMIVISSCSASIIMQIMEREGIHHHFDCVLGAEEDESKVQKFKKVLAKYNLEKSNCLFVTDTLGDLKEAEKIGIESIAVSWGYHDIDTLKQGKYKKMIHKTKDLLLEINNFFKL